MNQNIVYLIAGVILAAAVGYLGFTAHQPSLGNVITQGIIPLVSSQSDVVVGPLQALTVAAAKSNCTSRVISTASTSLELAFSSTYTIVNGRNGVWQAASTTKEYDNANYGCGAITGLASASSTVSVLVLTQ